MKLSNYTTLVAVGMSLLAVKPNPAIASVNRSYENQITEILKDQPRPTSLREEINLLKDQIAGEMKKKELFREVLTFSMNGQKMLLKLSYDNKTNTLIYEGLLLITENGPEKPDKIPKRIHEKIQQEIKKLETWDGWAKEALKK